LSSDGCGDSHQLDCDGWHHLSCGRHDDRGMGVFVPIGLCWINVASFFASLSCSFVKLLLDKDAVLLISESCLCLPLALGVKGVSGSESSCRMKLLRLVGCGSKLKLFTSEHGIPR
jgi:hypothetical protein